MLRLHKEYPKWIHCFCILHSSPTIKDTLYCQFLVLNYSHLRRKNSIGILLFKIPESSSKVPYALPTDRFKSLQVPGISYKELRCNKFHFNNSAKQIQNKHFGKNNKDIYHNYKEDKGMLESWIEKHIPVTQGTET